jgi:hypothetical protein
LQMGETNTTCTTCRSECCAIAYKPHAKCQSCMVAGLKMSDNTLCFQLIYLTAFMEPVWPWSWSYGSWIYNYLCNQCISPLVVSLNPAHCEVYSIQHYVMKFVIDL